MKEENIDFIGDIHGHADKLELLLDCMGYRIVDGSYRHPFRKVIFVGDIDRGPDSPSVYRIVRSMVDKSEAYAIMGNHVYNAILFNT